MFPFCKALVLLALLFGVSQRARGAGEDQTHALSPARIAQVPLAERGAWETYGKRSEAHLSRDKATLSTEVLQNRLEKPLPAPNGQGFRAARSAPANWFGGEEARRMADAAVSFQTPSGGWSKGVAYDAGERRAGMHWTTVVGDDWYYVGTFDNGAHHGALTTLAKIYGATRDPRYAAAFLRGLDYIFDAQYPNGGWPQNYPLVGWYHDEITFNDDAMTNIVALMRDIATAQPDYAWVDAARRTKARAAMEAGLGCILRAQIVQNGKLTVWCAQHDPLTLGAAPARAFEIASLSGGESANVVRFLMGIEAPNPEIQNAIQSAVAWFETSKIPGFDFMTRKNAAGGNAFYLAPNPNAAPLWARFYELGTNRPVFVTREVKIHYDLADLDQSGPGGGYRWYVNTPQKVLDEFPRWLAKNQVPNPKP